MPRPMKISQSLMSFTRTYLKLQIESINIACSRENFFAKLFKVSSQTCRPDQGMLKAFSKLP